MKAARSNRASSFSFSPSHKWHPALLYTISLKAAALELPGVLPGSPLPTPPVNTLYEAAGARRMPVVWRRAAALQAAAAAGQGRGQVPNAGNSVADAAGGKQMQGRERRSRRAARPVARRCRDRAGAMDMIAMCMQLSSALIKCSSLFAVTCTSVNEQQRSSDRAQYRFLQSSGHCRRQPRRQKSNVRCSWDQPGACRGLQPSRKCH